MKQFDVVNFRDWCYRMKSLLEQNGVLHVLSTELPTTEADLKKFKHEDAKAKNVLVQGLANNMLSMIISKNSAQEIVDTLATTYEKRGMKSMQCHLISIVLFLQWTFRITMISQQLVWSMLAEKESLIKKDDPHNFFASYRRPRGKSGQYSQFRYSKGSNVPGISFNGKCYCCKTQGHMKMNCPN
ncbi:hypothetical protein PR048_003271 [Dryococelus australis]|uniref:CCHC-type domain-containing protein n=1 Tax=Dryococelus australis TaxID=614101 RepID=A0ABQ9IMN4_9NEOP|nr:hypothetical protein PR048_003271 [Dryococelus australis]